MDAGQPAVASRHPATTPPAGGVVVFGLLLLAGLLVGCSKANDSALELSCDQPTTSVGDIQGSAQESSMIGQDVVVRAVATRSVRDDDRHGVFAQQTTSSGTQGMFLQLTGPTPIPAPGTLIVAAGRVREIDGLTSLNVSDLKTCSERVGVTPTPFVPGTNPESVEGVLLSISEPMTVSDLYRSHVGEVLLSRGDRLWQPTELAQPGEAAQSLARQNRSRELWVAWPGRPAGIRVGDTIESLVGVMDQSKGYRLRISETPLVKPTNPRPHPPSRKPEHLRVVAFNLLNYFNGNGMGADFPTPRGAENLQELERQQDKLIAAMKRLDADVFALAELENDGFDEHSAVDQLTRALTRSSGRNYRHVSPRQERLGDGAIAVGLIYDADRLAPQGPAFSRLDAPFDQLNRPPLGQTFRRADGELLTVVAVHLKSKGCGDASGADLDQNDGQGCWNLARTRAARALVDWVQELADPATTLLIGDFNAYSREEPIRAITDLGYVHLSASDAGDSHSFVYRGWSGSLDHALAGNALADRVVQIQHWHINADEPRWLDYNLENGSEFFRPDPYRSSDHDPLIIDSR